MFLISAFQGLDEPRQVITNRLQATADGPLVQDDNPGRNRKHNDACKPKASHAPRGVPQFSNKIPADNGATYHQTTVRKRRIWLSSHARRFREQSSTDASKDKGSGFRADRRT